MHALKSTIILDSDGFFWPDSIEAEYMHSQRELVSINYEQQPYDVLFEQYYLGFRSALFICEDTINNADEAEKTLRQYREACLGSAMRYMRNHLEAKPSLPVDFMWIVRETIVSELKDCYSEVNNIKLQLSMKPRLSARAVDKNTIVFPALTRSVLTHCNLVIINSIDSIINESGQLVGDLDRKYLARFIFPYLLYCHDDFSVQNLPIIGAHSKESILNALSFTNLQIMFIIAHEYAHILLRHIDDNKTFRSKEDIESEADTFALNVVLAYVEKSDRYSIHDVFAAIRWLYKYQIIEKSIGMLIKGESLDFFESNLEDRRGKIQLELRSKHRLKGSSLFESLGFCMIVELQNILYEYGSNLINEITNAFHDARRTGKLEPWWESIAQDEAASKSVKKVVDIFLNQNKQEEKSNDSK